MATITLTYDARNTLIKKAIDVVLLAGAKMVTTTPKRKKCGLDLAIEEIEQGKVTKCKDFDDFVAKINA